MDDQMNATWGPIERRLRSIAAQISRLQFDQDAERQNVSDLIGRVDALDGGVEQVGGGKKSKRKSKRKSRRKSRRKSKKRRVSKRRRR